MDIKTRYNKNSEEINEKIKLLKERLKKHNKGFQNNQVNWGYVGDLHYVKEKLEEVLTFIK